MLVLTYGTLPPFDAFERGFKRVCPDGVFKVRNCKELDDCYPGGNADLSLEKCWDVIVTGSNNWTCNAAAGTIAADILYSLGIEWV